MTNRRDFDGYELIDFGDGQKLERFGSLILSRPSVAANHYHRAKDAAKDWEDVDLIFDSRWRPNSTNGAAALKSHWSLRLRTGQASIEAELRATAAGHVGLFPEHLDNFERFLQPYRTELKAQDSGKQPAVEALPRALHLFAYTGIGSIQCAQAGFQVAHVDASKPSVQWAKTNLQRNLEPQQPIEAVPIRFYVDDALAFCKREVRRGRRYEVICLDPPAYGHGPSGKAWQLQRDLPELCEVLQQLLSDRPLAIMLTGHSDRQLMEELIKSRALHELTQRFGQSVLDSVDLMARNGKRLNVGYCMTCMN